MNDLCFATGKVCYSKREAGVTLARCRHSKRNRVPRRIYFCKECGWYHLTSLLRKVRGNRNNECK